MDEKHPLRRQPDDHHFRSLLMLAITADAFLLVTWGPTKVLFFLLQDVRCWQGEIDRIFSRQGFAQLADQAPVK